MTVSDGTVLETTKIVDNGSASHRLNLLVISEGYTAGIEMTQFSEDAEAFVDALFATAPIDDYKEAINVYRIDVTSTDSGADDPDTCTGGTGATANTYFDATFCSDGVNRRFLTVNKALVEETATDEVVEWDSILVIVNSSIHGGTTTGDVGVTSKVAGWEDLAIHEIGHSVFKLADEYEYWAGCGIDTNRDNYTGPEPSEFNITKDTTSSIKWSSLVLSSTTVPTTENDDCTKCDPQGSPVPSGTVGAFEGAGYYHCDLYRPEFNCKMRVITAPFCAVCQQEIRKTLGLDHPFGVNTFMFPFHMSFPYSFTEVVSFV